jgi:hypothetical protein
MWPVSKINFFPAKSISSRTTSKKLSIKIYLIKTNKNKYSRAIQPKLFQLTFSRVSSVKQSTTIYKLSLSNRKSVSRKSQKAKRENVSSTLISVE